MDRGSHQAHRKRRQPQPAAHLEVLIGGTGEVANLTLGGRERSQPLDCYLSATPAGRGGMPTKTSEGHAHRDEWDRPLGNLDGLTRVRLDRTHLEAAVAEVRFTTNADLSEQHAISIWQGLGEESFPVFTKH